MKNPTLLKDELRLLSQDKSALVKELDKVGNELKKLNAELVDTEAKLRVAKSELSITVSSASYIAGQIVYKEDELNKVKLAIDSCNDKLNQRKVIASQEINLHTAKIKELENDEQSIKNNIDALKKNYDDNSKIYLQHLSEKNATLRKLDTEIEGKNEVIGNLTKEIKDKQEELEAQDRSLADRESKMLEKEQTLDLLVKSNELKQIDLINASRDLIIVYQRLKELYAVIDPKLDVDRLFSKLLNQ